jgi:uncharacterized membrane protein
MRSKVKIAGHPVHPMLIVFPLGLLVTSLVFDIFFFAGGRTDPGFALVAFWNISLGLLGGLIAAPFGTVDWLSIPRNTRAFRIGALHGLANLGVLGLFFASWVLRVIEADHVVTWAAFTLSILGVGLGTVSGWLGGELVDRLGVGVDDHAHLDAPSSLARALPRSAAEPPATGSQAPLR